MGAIGEFKASVKKISKETGEAEWLTSVSNSIYFENDNEAVGQFKVTKEFIESLKPGDKIVLCADGRDDQCGYGEDGNDYDDY